MRTLADEEMDAAQVFKKTNKIGRAVYWDSQCGRFVARAYSSTIIALEANKALDASREERDK